MAQINQWAVNAFFQTFRFIYVWFQPKQTWYPKSAVFSVQCSYRVSPIISDNKPKFWIAPYFSKMKEILFILLNESLLPIHFIEWKFTLD